MRCLSSGSVIVSVNSGDRRSIVVYSMPYWLAIGVVVGIVGPTLESIRSDFDLTYTAVSSLFLAMTLGHVVGTITGGFASDRIGRRTTLSFGVVLFMIGLVTCGFTPTMGVFVGGAIIYGVGFGMSDATLNAAICDASGHAVGRALTLSQIPFGAGALVAPPIVSVLLPTYVGWRGAYLGAAAVVGLAALLIALVRFPEHDASRTKTMGLLRGMTRPVPILLGAVVSMYFGIQIGFSGFLPAHLEATLNFDRSYATAAVAVYWAGLLFGRVLGVWLASRVQSYDLAAGSLSLTLVAALITAATSHTVVILISVMFAGVAIGPLFTIVMGIGVRGNPATAGSIAGLILAIGGLSSVGLWLFMGAVADVLSVQAVIGLVPLFMGTGLVFLLLARAHQKSRGIA